MRIYKTADGSLRDQSSMYWEFIKSMGLIGQYKLFHKAIVEKEIYVDTEET